MPLQKHGWVLSLNELDSRRKVLAAPEVCTFGWGVQHIIWKDDKQWLLPTPKPGTYCQLVSEKMDSFCLSEGEQKTHAWKIANSMGPALGHHQGLLMSANSLLRKEKHGQEIWQWHKTIEHNFLGQWELCGMGDRSHYQGLCEWLAGLSSPVLSLSQTCLYPNGTLPSNYLGQALVDGVGGQPAANTVPQERGNQVCAQLSHCQKARPAMNDVRSQKRSPDPKSQWEQNKVR